MKSIVILLLLVKSFCIVAQSTSTNQKLIEKYTLSKKDINSVNKDQIGSNNLYHKLLKHQILSDCKFEMKCKRYIKSSFQKYGLIKGLFLSTDRVIRCDRITNATASPHRINRKGKMIDHLEEYQNK